MILNLMPSSYLSADLANFLFQFLRQKPKKLFYFAEIYQVNQNYFEQANKTKQRIKYAYEIRKFNLRKNYSKQIYY